MFNLNLFSKKSLKYVVIGSDIVGGSLSAFLKSGGNDVTLITKYPHLVEAAKKQNGIRLISQVKGDKIYKVNIVHEDNLSSKKVDVIIICVRTPDFKSTFSVIKKLAHKNTIIMSISNGFGIGASLQQQLPDYNVIEAAFVGMCRWFERESPTYLQKREYCEFKFSTRKGQNINQDILKEFEKNILDSGMTGGYINPDEMQSLLFGRLITRSPFETCCLLYDITANEIMAEKADLFKNLCNELVVLAKALNIRLENNVVDEYLKNFEAYKKRDDANVVSSILTDIKSGQKPEIDYFLFEPVRLAKKCNIILPNYFKIAEKYSQYDSLTQEKAAI